MSQSSALIIKNKDNNNNLNLITTKGRYKFHNLVHKNINMKVSLKTTQEIDEAINKFTNIIQSAAWDAIPTQTQFLNSR